MTSSPLLLLYLQLRTGLSHGWVTETGFGYHKKVFIVLILDALKVF